MNTSKKHPTQHLINNPKDQEEQKRISYYIKGVFLLSLAILGNFLAETLNCPLRSLLTNNAYAKQIIIFFLIYFTVDLTDFAQTANPTNKLLSTVFIWICFLFLTQLDLRYTISVFILLAVIYILQTYIEFYATKDISVSNRLICIQNIVEFITFSIIVIGFGHFIYKKKGVFTIDDFLEIQKCNDNI